MFRPINLLHPQGLTKDEINERRIMKLMLKIKNGTPPMRKVSLRQITDNARSFGAGPLFNQILPLLMSPTLEDQERHLLVKVVDRVLCVPPPPCHRFIVGFDNGLQVQVG
jgi:hypothetical protein